jgi:hypothetical protein
MGEFPRKPDGRGVFPVEFEPGVLKSCATRPPRASVLAQRGGGADDCNICLGDLGADQVPVQVCYRSIYPVWILTN